jgi:hypothetical protein
MKVKYLGKDNPLMLLHNEIYEVLSIEDEWYRIIDETDEDYLYPPDLFEIVEEDNKKEDK